MGTPIFDPASHYIIGHVSSVGHFRYVFAGRDDQSAWSSVVAAFPGEEVQLIDWSADRSRVLVRVDGTRNGSEYELIDRTTNLARDIGPAYSGIRPEDVAEVRFLSYAASDGRYIPAFLTLPRGRAAKNLPLIVFPHGGPAAQDDPGFNFWAQAMASRGYAVLQPEFRGSDGFGWDHTVAGFGEFGRKMQSDLSDGVRFLAQQGLIDSKRVCIVGGSYGGYAALAGVTLQHGVYRCAVSVAGISDPGRFLRWIRNLQNRSDSLPTRYWERFLGADSYDDPKLAAISPYSYGATADAPILLIHGSDDTVVPIEQSELMERALVSAHKPVVFIKLKSEDHWL